MKIQFFSQCQYPSLNTQSCNNRPSCSTFTFGNVRSSKKTMISPHFFLMYWPGCPNGPKTEIPYHLKPLNAGLSIQTGYLDWSQYQFQFRNENLNSKVWLLQHLSCNLYFMRNRNPSPTQLMVELQKNHKPFTNMRLFLVYQSCRMHDKFFSFKKKPY